MPPAVNLNEYEQAFTNKTFSSTPNKFSFYFHSSLAPGPNTQCAWPLVWQVDEKTTQCTSEGYLDCEEGEHSHIFVCTDQNMFCIKFSTLT
jgi:hypothetical protein